ncbi:MAG TPA: alpha/beta hydrolase [Pseudonocardia sp.]|nr:alpha/beta hydrolase [Pseudonocardia sp.]
MTTRRGTTPGRFTVRGPAGAISALVWDGPPEELPVLFLHPVNTGASVWDAVAPALGRRALAIDYRGHGRSDPGPSYLPADFAADALAALDHVGWSTVALAGGSIGGAVAVEIASRVPERVAGVACFGATLRIGLTEGELAPALADLSARGPSDWFAANGADIIGPASVPGVVERLVELSRGRESATVSEIVRATFSLADARPAAQRLPRVPALVAVGTHDTTCPLSMATELASHLRTDVVTLPGIGHLPMLEAPGEVARLLEELLRRADHPGG